MTHLWRRALMMIVAGALLALPSPTRAEHITFGQPEATAVLGQPIIFTTTLQAGSEQPRVELLLLNLPDEQSAAVLSAEVTADGSGWRAVATLEGHIPPNTPLRYRFRVRDAEGTTVGPVADALVTDDRFAWQTIEGPIVRLHWYAGDEAFARRALDIGQLAIDNASALLGVVETEPIDFFIYDSEQALRPAIGPGARENVGGQAHADIRTMFGAISAFEINSDWVDTLVTHELTHLVFDTATDNPYHQPPRWLNEGVAVYLSEGYTAEWRSVVDRAVRGESLIPLNGLGGLFPTTAEQFGLAYGESVSAIDFFVRTHDEETLWNLVGSYAQGTSDDDAFRAATGDDLAAFNAAWMASLDVEVPQPFGPRPGPPGPLPPGWDAQSMPPASAQPTAPGSPAGPAGSPMQASPGPSPASTAAPGAAGGGTTSDQSRVLVLILLSVLAIVLAVVLGILLGRRRRALGPPGI